MKLLFSITGVFLLFTFGYGQNEYTPLKSSGTIPDDFLYSSYQRYLNEVEKIDQTEKRFERNAKKQFLLESTLEIDELLRSGTIVFNDPISIYINKIADVLLADQPDLRKEIRFYTTRSPYVNAFSTDRGIIFVNVGLVAQVSNEAELAYVLAHEIIHYIKKHNIELYLKNQTITREKGYHDLIRTGDLLLKKNNWSKEIELEADEMALTDFFSKSNYSLAALESVFEVLQYSYLPFDEILFDHNFFNNENLILPERYFPAGPSPIKTGDDFQDEKSTHPNSQVRSQKLLEIAAQLPDKKRYDFIVSEEEFNSVKKIARFETIRSQLIEKNYGDALYNSYVLLKLYPGDKFLEKSICAALYGMSKYSTYSTLSTVVHNPSRIEGESYVLYYLLKKLKTSELNVLAISYIWSMRQKYPDDYYLNEISNDLMNDLFHEKKYTINDFSFKTKSEVATSLKKEINEIDSSKLNKYSKIKIAQKKVVIEDTNWVKYALVSLLTDTVFYNRMQYYSKNSKFKAYDLGDKMPYKYDEDLSGEENLKRRKELRKRYAFEYRYGVALGINKILVVDPIFRIYDNRKETEFQLAPSEQNNQKFISKIEKYGAMNGLDISVIDYMDLTKSDVDKFNDISVCQLWLSEKFEIGKMNFVLNETENLNLVSQKYGVDNFCITGVITRRYPKDYSYILYEATMSVFFFPILPFTLYYWISPKYQMDYLFLLFDTKTGLAKMKIFETYNSNGRGDLINQLIYNSLFQIKNTR